jgi:hypothetical protein
VPYHVRVHPIFYNRLAFGVETLEASADVEIEIVGRHLSAIETQFADQWDTLPVDPQDPQSRYVEGLLPVIPAIFVVRARMQPTSSTISIRDIVFITL